LLLGYWRGWRWRMANARTWITLAMRLPEAEPPNPLVLSGLVYIRVFFGLALEGSY